KHSVPGPLPPPRHSRAPLYLELYALMGRALRNVLRNPLLAAMHVALTVAVALVVGSLFRDVNQYNGETAGIQNRLGVLFFLLLYLSLLGLTSLPAWQTDLWLFRHEKAAKAYGTGPYLASILTADILACRIVPPVILASIVHPAVGLHPGRLVGLILSLAAFNLALGSVLALCGVIGGSSAGGGGGQKANALGCLVVLFSTLLSGFLVARGDLPGLWKALARISPMGNAFDALIYNEFSGYGPIFRLSTKISNHIAYSDPLTGDNIMGCFGLGKDNGGVAGAIGVLLLLSVASLTATYVLLKLMR
ncbi:unnamed protein product, partial [Discosporangium mesarthrocarpum]